MLTVQFKIYKLFDEKQENILRNPTSIRKYNLTLTESL